MATNGPWIKPRKQLQAMTQNAHPLPPLTSATICEQLPQYIYATAHAWRLRWLMIKLWKDRVCENCSIKTVLTSIPARKANCHCHHPLNLTFLQSF